MIIHPGMKDRRRNSHRLLKRSQHSLTENHHGGGEEGVDSGGKFRFELPKNPGDESTGAGEHRLDEEANNDRHLEVSGAVIHAAPHVCRSHFQHPQPLHPPVERSTLRSEGDTKFDGVQPRGVLLYTCVWR